MSAARHLETRLKLLHLGDRGKAASVDGPRWTPRRSPKPANTQQSDPSCPLCGETGSVDGKWLRCFDCGVFDADGRGGWLRRPHCNDTACTEVLALPARALLRLPSAIVLRVERRGEVIAISTSNERIAASLVRADGTVARWLEHNGARLLHVQVVE